MADKFIIAASSEYITNVNIDIFSANIVNNTAKFMKWFNKSCFDKRITIF